MDTYWNAPAEKPASAVLETGGGGYILFADCEEGGCRVPKIWRYEVYRRAPTLQLVRDSSWMAERGEGELPDVCEHGWENMIGNEAPSVLLKFRIRETAFSG